MSIPSSISISPTVVSAFPADADWSSPAVADNIVPNSPTDNIFFGGGFDANNVILAGEGNKIINSRRCSVIQGFANEISGKYNTHIIGDFVNADADNTFFVGCENFVTMAGASIGGGISAGGDVVAFSSSDKRLKDDITLIDEPLSKVMSLDAIEFNWNDNQSTYTGHDIGLVAQQVEEVAPEIVETRKDGYKAIKYEKVNALLVGAIQEQQKKIEFLEKRLESLERRSSRS